MSDQALHRADQLLTELVETVETARAVPMSASCVIPRERVLDLLDELRDVLPPEMIEARSVVAQRDTLLNDAQQRADAIIADADERVVDLRQRAEQHALELIEQAEAQAAELVQAGRVEHGQLVSATGVHQAAAADAESVKLQAREFDAAVRDEARDYAETVRADADRYAEALRGDADGYAEQTLSDLIDVLGRALATTEQGRATLGSRRTTPREPLASLSSDAPPDPPCDSADESPAAGDQWSDPPISD